MDDCSLYCDGGVISVNPSPEGGTWAWVLVGDDEIKLRCSGLVTPKELGLEVATNNMTELMACIKGLETMKLTWKGTLYTDSQITQFRLMRDGTPFRGIPAEWVNRAQAVRKRFPHLSKSIVLLDGHPNKSQLASGIGKRGNPCSKWNVECDKECGRLAFEFKAAKLTAGQAV